MYQDTLSQTLVSKESSCNAQDQVWFLGWEDPLEKEMATYSSILAWQIPWTEETGRPQSMGVTRVGHDLATEPPLPKMGFPRGSDSEDILMENTKCKYSHFIMIWKTNDYLLHLMLKIIK